MLISPGLAYKFSNPHVKFSKVPKSMFHITSFQNMCGGQEKSVADWLKLEVENAFSAQCVQVRI